MKFWPIVLAADIAFFISMNSYFGWNWTPKSGDEVVADGISFVLFSIFVVVYILEAK